MSQLRTLLALSIASLFLTGCGGIFSALLGTNGVTYNSIHDDISRLNGQDGLNPNGDGGSLGGNGSGGSIDGEGTGGSGGEEPTEILPTFELGTIPVPSCFVGELDVIKYGLQCHKELPVIATLIDEDGEKLIKDFGSLGDNPDLVKELKDLQVDVSYRGDSVELLLCIDANANGSCKDESVHDLEEISKVILGHIRNNGVKMTHDAGKGHIKDDITTGLEDTRIDQLCDNAAIKTLNQGLVLFHNRHKFVDEADFTTSAIISGGVAEVMETYVNNMKKGEVIGEFVRDIEFKDTPQFILVEADVQYCSELGHRLGMGCFVEGTKIQVSKNTSMDVELLRKGDEVLLSNGKMSQIEEIVKGPELKPVIEFKLKNSKKVTVTDAHPMLTQRGVIQAKEVTIADQFLSNGSWTSIVAMTSKTYKGDVYNFVLAGEGLENHLLVSDDIVTGDLFLQRKLSKEKDVPFQFVNLDGF